MPRAASRLHRPSARRRNRAIHLGAKEDRARRLVLPSRFAWSSLDRTCARPRTGKYGRTHVPSSHSRGDVAPRRRRGPGRRVRLVRLFHIQRGEGVVESGRSGFYGRALRVRRRVRCHHRERRDRARFRLRYAGHRYPGNAQRRPVSPRSRHGVRRAGHVLGPVLAAPEARPDRVHGDLHDRRDLPPPRGVRGDDGLRRHRGHPARQEHGRHMLLHHELVSLERRTPPAGLDPRSGSVPVRRRRRRGRRRRSGKRRPPSRATPGRGASPVTTTDRSFARSS